jgi:MFS family permease
MNLKRFLIFCSSLDRSNISNAKTANFSNDIKLVDNQFNLILTWYFIPFIILGPPVALITKRFSAKYSISGMMVGFGFASLGTGWVRNYGDVVACRILVGAFEAGFLTS